MLPVSSSSSSPFHRLRSKSISPNSFLPTSITLKESSSSPSSSSPFLGLSTFRLLLLFLLLLLIVLSMHVREVVQKANKQERIQGYIHELELVGDRATGLEQNLDSLDLDVEDLKRFLTRLRKPLKQH